jgi:hypothetical protein
MRAIITGVTALAAAVAAAAPAAALDTGAADRRSLSLTVYNENLALVREVRKVELPQGATELRFMDVPVAIRPETVTVTSAGRGQRLEVLEQNYEYDLLSHEQVLEKYVGRDVTVYVKNDETGEERAVTAKLLSTEGGLIFDMGNEIALGLPGRIVVPKLPENLIARPTLVWLLRGAAAGETDIEVGYLTGAIGWHADYVARLSPDESTLDLTGWVTIDNRSGAAYENAKLKLVAGDVNVVRPPERPMMREMAMAADATLEAGFAERQMFEYHLYELERSATVKNNQQKQIELLAAAAVPVTKRYRAESIFSPYQPQPHTGTETVQKMAVALELTNEQKMGLGRALPKGVVRVYKRDEDEALVFTGEDSIDHTPEGERITLEIGKAFDVVWERNVLSFNEISRQYVEAEVEVVVRNRKDKDVTATVVERFTGERSLLSSSIKAREPNAFTLEFDVPVPAKGEQKVTYKVRARR